MKNDVSSDSDEEEEDPFLTDVLPPPGDKDILNLARKFRRSLTSQSVRLTSATQDMHSTDAQKVDMSARIHGRKIYFRYNVNGRDVLKKPPSNGITSCCFEFENTTKLIWCQLFLQKEHRRKGYGRLLIALIKTAARICGVQEIEARCPPNSRDMRRFFTITGFKKNAIKNYVCTLPSTH